jgi:hypothetical protein
MRNLIALALVIGCSGGGAKTAEPPANKMGDAGAKIADTLKLSELKDADQEALCDQLYVLRQPETLMQATCQVTALGEAEGNTDEEARASCKQAQQRCLATPKPPSAACPVYDALKAPKCAERTVGEVRRCTLAGAARLTKFVSSDPCSMIVAVGDRLVAVRAMLAIPECEIFETCDQTVEGDADFQTRAVEPVIGFKDQICACADKACAIKVDDEFRTWDALLELPSDAKPGPETEKRLKDTLAAYRTCLGKLAPERNTH